MRCTSFAVQLTFIDITARLFRILRGKRLLQIIGKLRMRKILGLINCKLSAKTLFKKKIPYLRIRMFKTDQNKNTKGSTLNVGDLSAEC